MHHTRMLSASSLIGDKVINAAGEDLGNIETLMIEASDGCISYAVLSFGGFLGLGDKLFAVPWDALSIDRERRRVIFDISKERLENAPGFDKDNWPDMASETWARGIDDYYSR